MPLSGGPNLADIDAVSFELGPKLADSRRQIGQTRHNFKPTRVDSGPSLAMFGKILVNIGEHCAEFDRTW